VLKHSSTPTVKNQTIAPGKTPPWLKVKRATAAVPTYGRDKACLLKHSVEIHSGLWIQLNDLSRFEGLGR